MPQEIDQIVSLLTDTTVISEAGRDYYSGLLNGIQAVVVFSRCGKVAAAATTCALIMRFKVTELYFIGVAGGLSNQVKVGDIVVADRLVQHDMDARPLYERFQLPLLGKIYFESDTTLSNRTLESVKELLGNNLQELLGIDIKSKFGIDKPVVVFGDVASGDQFINSDTKREFIKRVLPDVKCVEMEGAAFAQICYEYGVPFCVIRIISDTADQKADFDFLQFVDIVASSYSRQIVKKLFFSDNS